MNTRTASFPCWRSVACSKSFRSSSNDVPTNVLIIQSTTLLALHLSLRFVPLCSLVLLLTVGVLSCRDFILWAPEKVIGRRQLSLADAIRWSVEASDPILSVDYSHRAANIAVRLPLQQIIQKRYPGNDKFEDCLISQTRYSRVA